VAGNAASFDLFSVESDTVASAGFNLIGGTNVLISPGPNDQFNLTAAELKLGPLQDNGGPTFTHALLCGSPAIDAGDNADAPETDQRGLPRIVNSVIDIGAYEDDNTAPTILCPTPATLEADASGQLAATVSVQVADADGDELIIVWSMDGKAAQTNQVAAAGVPPTKLNVSFTTSFAVGSHTVLVRVIDTRQCAATCSTTVLVTPPAVQVCTAVLQLGAGKVSVTGPAGGILGDVGIGRNGSFAMSGDEFVTGTIRLGAGANSSNSSHGTVHVAKNVDLSAEINAAYAKATSAAKLPCTQSFSKLDGKSVTTIAGVAAVNVICVRDVNLSGKQVTLFGPPGASFIINVTGNFVLTGGGRGPQIRVAGGVQPRDVLYNIIGPGSDVAFSGGGGGEDCCAAIVDGTVLAPQRKIRLSPGLVNGAVISSRDISIVSGSSVRCPAGR
jgi:choice-of-anchor A domain-containing protein